MKKPLFKPKKKAPKKELSRQKIASLVAKLKA